MGVNGISSHGIAPGTCVSETQWRAWLGAGARLSYLRGLALRAIDRYAISRGRAVTQGVTQW